MKVRCFSIEWDTDNPDEGGDIECPTLPDEAIVEVDDDVTDDDLENESILADKLSDQFGWAVYGLAYRRMG